MQYTDQKKLQAQVVGLFSKKYDESISSTCRLLGVSRQVYYRSTKAMMKRKKVAAKVVHLVIQLRSKMPRLGTRKIYYLLKDELHELKVGRDKLFSILKANHMLIKPKRSYHITTHSHHRFRKHKNLIQQIHIERPEQVWVADITYVGRQSNPLYLALITDAYSKKIMGYNVSNTLATKGSLKALKMAIGNRIYSKKDLIHHSDRGIQYCSDEYQKHLARKEITCSMTESYDPYQNAVAERVNGILKQEFLIQDQNINLVFMQKLVEQSIKIYNRERPHWSCHMLTPDQMHKQKGVKIKTYKTKKSRELQLSGF